MSFTEITERGLFFLLFFFPFDTERRNRETGTMEPVKEEEEVYSWREVNLPALSPTAAAEPELERETGERRRGRDILIAVDHGPNSKHAFDWALIHLCRLADTIHLVHAVSSMFKFYPPPLF